VLGRVGLLVAGIATALAVAVPVARAAGPEQQLAERYAPIVALKQQDEACDRSGEGWRPTAIDAVLGNPAVRLRGPVEKRAPSAADLFGLGEGYYLDLRGDPLSPGCDYERDARRLFRGQPSIAYAHIAREAGIPHRLALQYWLYYYFNDFHDKHESDWEGIQILFEADSAGEALRKQPLEVAYAQHNGGERAAWDSKKLELAGTHPVVYVASGSHAAYYSSAIWLGRGAGQGWGCDDARGPSHRLRLDAVVLPTRVSAPADRYAWLAYEGRWGQRESGPNNGPTGPNTKSSWTQPLTWQEQLRDRSFQVPAAVTLGDSVSGTFCGAVSVVATLFNFFGSPIPIAALLGVLLALLVVAATRTRWRPARAHPLRARRTTGQILSASTLVYWRHRWLLLGIGAIAVPLAFAAVSFERLIHWRSVERWVDLPAWTLGLIRLDVFELFVSVVAINATTAIALDHLDARRSIAVGQSYRLALGKFWPLARSVAIQVVVGLLLFVSVIGIPWLLRMMVGGALTAQEIVIDREPVGSIRRSSQKLVVGHWWRTAGLLVALYLVAFAAAPLVGFALFFVTSVSPGGVDLIGSLVYAFALPYVAVASTLLYFDLQERPLRRPAPSPFWRRMAAIGALLAALGVVVLTVMAVLADMAAMVQAFIAVLVIAVGAWFALTRRRLARLVGVIVFLAGLVALVIVGMEHWSALLTLAMAAGLVTVFGLAARAAAPGDPELRRIRATPGRILLARQGALIVNPKSGGGKAERFQLVAEARKRGIEPILLEPGDDLHGLAERAVAQGADVIGMAGGDGSQAIVAAVAMEHDVAHVCVPAGTRNHFALDLGIDREDVVGALDAFTAGVERRIDLASVNGRVFVNNASVGAYAQVVQSEAYRDAKLATWTRMLPAVLGPDAPQPAFALVSNNPYRFAGIAAVGTRPRLDTGRLGIVTAEIDQAADVARLLALATVGRWHRFRGLREWSDLHFEVHSQSPVPVGLDGEALVFDPPLRFVSLPGALRVRLPRNASGISPAAAAVGLTRHELVALLRLAAGRQG